MRSQIRKNLKQTDLPFSLTNGVTDPLARFRAGQVHDEQQIGGPEPTVIQL
jgi:hypothetical protein